MPTDVPSEDLFETRMAGGVRVAISWETVKSVASGFQEGYRDMLGIQEVKDPRKQKRRGEGGEYLLTHCICAARGDCKGGS